MYAFVIENIEKECACHQNASFKPFTAIIGPTGRPVAMSIRLKQESRAAARKPRDAASVLFC